MFRRSDQQKFNLIAISIPWNRNLREYLYGIASLERFSFLPGSSVTLMEAPGGWITNLHQALHGSLHQYRPVFADAALDHLFTQTVYRNMTTATARENPSALESALNFESAFRMGDGKRVFPLMARYDQYIQLERQQGIYREDQIYIMDKEHVTGSMNKKSRGGSYRNEKE